MKSTAVVPLIQIKASESMIVNNEMATISDQPCKSQASTTGQICTTGQVP
jgi:hypothetical protein